MEGQQKGFKIWPAEQQSSSHWAVKIRNSENVEHEHSCISDPLYEARESDLLRNVIITPMCHSNTNAIPSNTAEKINRDSETTRDLAAGSPFFRYLRTRTPKETRQSAKSVPTETTLERISMLKNNATVPAQAPVTIVA